MNATLHDLHRPLGSTGLRISPLGLGTEAGPRSGVKYPNGFPSQTTPGRQLLTLARELGINLIDTAPAYGVERAARPVAGRTARGLGDRQQGWRGVRERPVAFRLFCHPRALLGGAQPQASAYRPHRAGAGAFGGNDLDILQHTEVTRPWPISSARARSSPSACPARRSMVGCLRCSRATARW